MKYKFKKFVSILTISLIFNTFLSDNIFAATKLYDNVKKEIVTNGVIYEHNQRLNVEGWQDIYTLTIDLNSPNIKISPVESSGEIGKKDTVSNMLKDSGAIAGVNADFFGMKGTHSASFGLTVDNNQLLSVGTDKNISINEYATFFIDNLGVPFIDFFNANIHFKTGAIDLELASVNKITEMKYPIYFDKKGADTTQALDERFSNLVKLTIQNDTITNISSKGEVITVPDDGYLIIMNGDYYDGISTGFVIGQPAITEFKTTLDLNNINTAISGGGKLLSAGQIVNDGVIIGGRQPRTALGISEDRTKLILMVVDGRGSSIGATHTELGWLMKEYGAYEAMHLDGGGSSTIVVQTINDFQNVVKNTVSDGVERKVMNSIGIFNTAAVSAPVELDIKPEYERAFVGNNIPINFVAYDNTYHKIDVPINEVQISVPEGMAIVDGNNIIPLVNGNIDVIANWNGLTDTTTIYGMIPLSIEANTDFISLSQGESIQLNIKIISEDGYEGNIDNSNVLYELSNQELGTINNGVFTALSDGAGYIKCTYNNTITYIGISVGGQEIRIDSFENTPILSFDSYPSELIQGFADISNVVYNDEITSLLLNYTFSESTSTQAAYLNFANPIVIPSKPSKLTLSLYGNNSGHWLRGVIKDSVGNEYKIDFTKNINWEGFMDVSAIVPNEVVYPISLETLYVVATSNTNIAPTQVFFDNLRAIVPYDVKNIPNDANLYDKFNGNTNNLELGDYYITMTGNVTLPENKKGYDYIPKRVEVNNNIQNNSDLAVYFDNDNTQLQNNIETITKNYISYQPIDKNGVTIINMQAAKGTISKTNSNQWLYFKADALASNDKNIIFMIDRKPSLFTDAREKELFENVLKEIKNSGKNIFVVYNDVKNHEVNINEGIRYIGLPNLWNDDGTYNQNYKMLRFKVNGDNILYEFI